MKNKSYTKKVKPVEICQLMRILDEHKERSGKIEGFDEQKKICGFDKPLRESTIESRNKSYAELAGQPSEYCEKGKSDGDLNPVAEETCLRESG